MPAWTPAPYSLPYIAANDVLEQTPATNQEQMKKISEYLAQVAGTIPIGMIHPYAGDDLAVLHPCWLPCDGTIIPNEDRYETLRTRIGYMYDPDGLDYKVPDLRGRALIGVGNENVVHNAINASLGEKVGDQRLQSHSHGVTDPGHTHTYTIHYAGGPGFGYNGLAGANATWTHQFFDQPMNSASTGISIQNEGDGTQANVPPSLGINFIILAATS